MCDKKVVPFISLSSDPGVRHLNDIFNYKGLAHAISTEASGEDPETFVILFVAGLMSNLQWDSIKAHKQI
jgi:hypothetical protein